MYTVQIMKDVYAKCKDQKVILCIVQGQKYVFTKCADPKRDLV